MLLRVLLRPFLFLALVAAGGIFSGALCSSYEADASRIVNDGQERVKEIAAASEADQRACATGAFEACDRTMVSISAMADELQRTHDKLVELKPSGDAKQWHTDYVAMLEKTLWTMRASVAAWDAGDLEAVISSGTALTELETEEARLTAYFNDNLR
jgi:hypothetical protein